VEVAMPLYMDVHELKDVTVEDVARAHLADVEKQGKYGVEYVKYWVNESCGKVFCLVHAPDPESANHVHREAHGMLAGRIIEVQPEMAEALIGGGEVNAVGAALIPPGAGAGLDTGIRTILFTDIVNSTSMTQQLGDKAAMALIQLHDFVVMEALDALAGRKVKHTGDGMMASFASAPAAIRCAVRIHEELARRSGAAREVRVRIGAAAGEPVEHHGDFFGSTVQLAARLCAHAQPEQIIVSTQVVELCAGDALKFHDLGEVNLKGFEQGVRAHAVAR
jgi:class 3 adenylate cyclase